jgi:hypothetical protein
MNFEAIQSLKRQIPYIGFVVELKNGRVISAPLPECFLVTKHGMVVGSPDNDRLAIFSFQDIRNIVMSPPSQA